MKGHNGLARITHSKVAISEKKSPNLVTLKGESKQVSPEKWKTLR